VNVTMEIVEITPKLAKEWLNGHNRHLRDTVWQRYARDMAAGNWELNGETIKRGEDGTTQDGQHRLKAVIESGCTIRSVVVSGLPVSAQETTDRGLPRNIADALRLRGEVDVNVLSGAITQAFVLLSPMPGDTRFWPSTREALAYLEANAGIRSSCRVGNRANEALRTPATTTAALHHIFSLIDADDADAFVDQLVTGAGLEAGSPILRLREIMLKENTVQRRMPRHRLQALWIKAWNAWRAGKSVQVLTWKPGGSRPEAFPKAA